MRVAMSFLPPPTLPRQSTRQVTPASKDTSFTFRTTTWQADGFGFDATSGEFFTASPTALVVMQCLAAKMTTAQILDCVTSTFEVSRRTAERDLESFLAELTTLGLQD
jgi:hypothetical protein